jgi:hypothetical protein
MADDKDFTESKIDIGVLKTQVLTLTSLCSKMDEVIEKLIKQHDRHIERVYEDMERRRLETEADINEIHVRIDTVLDKMQSSELRITDEIKSLHSHMLQHNKEEKEALEKMNQWKWMVYGGIAVLTWIVAQADILAVIKLFVK